VQPKPDDYDYELDEALASVVGIKSIVPADAFTAEIPRLFGAAAKRSDPPPPDWKANRQPSG